MTDQERAARLRDIARRLAGTYRDGGINRIGEKNLPPRLEIIGILEDLLRVIFPGYHGEPLARDSDLELWVAAQLDGLSLRLAAVIEKTLHFCYAEPCHCSVLWTPGADPGGVGGKEQRAREFATVARTLAVDYLSQLPRLRAIVRGDVQAAFEGDPAAVNQDEIILCYPGTFAISVHRLAHPLYRLGVPLVPRIMSEWAHQQTGVDIHPGAKIGERFFIDHGTGVVIGETTEIGVDVKIYQGVTLGALSFSRNPDGSLVKGGKRHPTIEDGVTIYASATILGGETVIGRNAVIGGGTWITRSVPSGEKVTLPQ